MIPVTPLSQHPRRIVAVVLAAGAGSRFGGGKLLASLEGRPVLQHVLDRLAEAGVGDVIVVLGDDAEAVEEAIDWRRERRVRNPEPESGPVELAADRDRGPRRRGRWRAHRARRPAAGAARGHPGRAGRRARCRATHRGPGLSARRRSQPGSRRSRGVRARGGGDRGPRVRTGDRGAPGTRPGSAGRRRGEPGHRHSRGPGRDAGDGLGRARPGECRAGGPVPRSPRRHRLLRAGHRPVSRGPDPDRRLGPGCPIAPGAAGRALARHRGGSRSLCPADRAGPGTVRRRRHRRRRVGIHARWAPRGRRRARHRQRARGRDALATGRHDRVSRPTWRSSPMSATTSRPSGRSSTRWSRPPVGCASRCSWSASRPRSPTSAGRRFTARAASRCPHSETSWSCCALVVATHRSNGSSASPAGSLRATSSKDSCGGSFGSNRGAKPIADSGLPSTISSRRWTMAGSASSARGHCRSGSSPGNREERDDGKGDGPGRAADGRSIRSGGLAGLADRESRQIERRVPGVVASGRRSGQRFVRGGGRGGALRRLDRFGRPGDR